MQHIEKMKLFTHVYDIESTNSNGFRTGGVTDGSCSEYIFLKNLWKTVQLCKSCI